MFEANIRDLRTILKKFNIEEQIAKINEITYYDEEDVRIILKVDFGARSSLIVKIRNESGYSREVFTQQTEFSEHLRQNGIDTAKYYLAENGYVSTILNNGKELYITVEDFKDGEIKVVTTDVCYKAGMLLAEAHNISERDGCHVKHGVIFDPFEENDLFGVEEFIQISDKLGSVAKTISDEILEVYNERLKCILPLKTQNKYAVQGDLSDCNMFLTESGNIGIFDFNNCGDANLFCDAVMQCVLLSRLMDYDRELTEEYSYELSKNFLNGYDKTRPFSSEQLAMLPHLYAIIDSFWKMDIVWNEDSLKNVLDSGNMKKVIQILNVIKNKINGNFNGLFH